MASASLTFPRLVAPAYRSVLGSTCMQTPSVSSEEKQPNPPNRRYEPQNHVYQVNPHSVLHPQNARLHFNPRTNVQLSEDAKNSCPQHEEDKVPGKEKAHCCVT
jgi:hypothetical protein